MTLEEELDNLRAPRDWHGHKCLGLSTGPYMQGQPEGGYGGPHLQRIREIRRALAKESALER